MQSATVKSRWSLYQHYGLAAALLTLAENIATVVRHLELRKENAPLRGLDTRTLSDIGFLRGDLLVKNTAASPKYRYHTHE